MMMKAWSLLQRWWLRLWVSHEFSRDVCVAFGRSGSLIRSLSGRNESVRVDEGVDWHPMSEVGARLKIQS